MRSLASIWDMTFAISVFPTPACPSTNNGFRSDIERCTAVATGASVTYCAASISSWIFRISSRMGRILPAPAPFAVLGVTVRRPTTSFIGSAASARRSAASLQSKDLSQQRLHILDCLGRRLRVVPDRADFCLHRRRKDGVVKGMMGVRMLEHSHVDALCVLSLDELPGGAEGVHVVELGPGRFGCGERAIANSK